MIVPIWEVRSAKAKKGPGVSGDNLLRTCPPWSFPNYKDGEDPETGAVGDTS